MPKKILMLTKGLGQGGAERLLVSGIGHIDRSRYHLEVAYVLPWKDALVSELDALDVPVHLLESRRAFDVRWVRGLRDLVDERGIDLVHTHMPYVGIGARLALPRAVPTLHTEHNLWKRYRPTTRVANMMTIARNRSVIAVSDAVAASMEPPKWVPVVLPPVVVIRYGADTTRIASGQDARTRARECLGYRDDDQIVGTVGNLTAKKDHASLLRATALLAGSGRRVRLVIVGTGPLEAELRALTSDLALDSCVTFTGLRSDVFDLLCAFDVFALSSRYEGLPIALLEAMAARVPVVATRVGGIPEVITDRCNGLLVDPGDPNALARALAELLDDPVRRVALGNEGAARSKEFDLADAMVRTQQLYDRVLEYS